VLLFPGLGLLGGGGTLLWAHGLNRSDGFVVSPQESFFSGGHALVSDRIELSPALDWLPVPEILGTARLEVTGIGARDVFVGVAREADARAYLDGVQRTVVDGLGFDGPATDGDQQPGGGPVRPPIDQDFWIAEASGGGTREVTWEPADGDWMFVVMNADGSRLVNVEARIGAEFPSLGMIGCGAFFVGAVLTFVVVRLWVRVFRRPWDGSVQYRQPLQDWAPHRTSSVHAGPAGGAGFEPGLQHREEHPA